MNQDPTNHDPTNQDATNQNTASGGSAMTTVSQAIDRLERMGFETLLEIGEDGRIAAVKSPDSWPADQVDIVHTYRFEGQSNPDDEAMVLGVAAPGGVRGVLTLPYGPDMSGLQADAVRQLTIREDR